MVALVSIGALGAGAVGRAEASQITIAPNTLSTATNFPFGTGSFWVPTMGFIYKDVPAFHLKANDVIAFDLSAMNDADDQVDIAMAPASSNGGTAPAGSYTTIVTNTQEPTNPRGDTTTGNFDLQYRVQLPFDFAGGGLIIRFSNPGSELATDSTATSVVTNAGGSADTSGHFVQRFFGDADGVPPYTNSDGAFIDAFRLNIVDPPQGGGGSNGSTTAKKCKKKKHHRSASVAKKKCKKKRH